MDVLWYILIGVAGGLLGGMGMGGGTLLIPLLTILMGTDQHIAQGINLIAFIPMAVVALIIHSKNKLVEFKRVLLFTIIGLLGSVGGSFVSQLLDAESLQIAFGIFLIVLGIFQGVSLFFFKTEKKEKKAN